MGIHDQVRGTGRKVETLDEVISRNLAMDLPAKLRGMARSLEHENKVLGAIIQRKRNDNEIINDRTQLNYRMNEDRIKALRQAADLLNQPIPAEHRTRTLTKSQAASLHADQKIENPTSYFAHLVKNGRIAKPMGSGQKWVFDIRDFPASTHDKLR